MRIFIGSSSEQRRLVEWLTAFIAREYQGRLEPVPWTMPWPGGRYTLENLLDFVDETDAAILFWTADDLTWYRDTQRHEPRDNLVFEAGLFIATHGRDRTQLLVPRYVAGDARGKVAAPSDVTGMTWNSYAWSDGPPETTELPNTARVVCDRLAGMGARPRTPALIKALSAHTDGTEELHTIVGDWFTINLHGIQRLARDPSAGSVDILAAYRVGEIARALDTFRARPGAKLRACFANVHDDQLLEVYRRKYHNRKVEYIRNALRDSLERLLGPCDVEVRSPTEIIVTPSSPPAADFEIRLTSQRITYGYYRIDDAAFVVPLDMKLAQDPAPPAWVVLKEVAPKTFERYLKEYNQVFEEAIHVFPRK